MTKKTPRRKNGVTIPLLATTILFALCVGRSHSATPSSSSLSNYATLPSIPTSSSTLRQRGGAFGRNRNKKPPVITEQPSPPPVTTQHTPLTLPPIIKQLGGASVITSLDLLLRFLFKRHSVAFPSMMAGCMGLFAVMVLAQLFSYGAGDWIFNVLNPGATFLTTWMPVFFVPGLVLLPLAPKIGDGLEVTKFLSVIIVGFLFSLLSITYSVLAIRSLPMSPDNDPLSQYDDDVETAAKKAVQKGRQRLLSAISTVVKETTDSVLNASKDGTDATLTAAKKAASKGRKELTQVAAAAAREAREGVTRAAFRAAEKVLPAVTKPRRPFSEELVRRYAGAAAVLGAATVYATLIEHPTLTTPLRTAFMLCTSIGSFVFGARLPPSFNKVIHPLVTSTVMTLALNYITAQLTRMDPMVLLATYRTGSLSLSSAGAGDLLLFALGPAVVALALPTYSRRRLAAENLPAVTLGTLVSSLGGLFSTALLVRILNLAARVIRLSLLTRNVTTALAIPITKMLGGDLSVCACVCVLTGITGATAAARLLTYLKITDPVSRGLAVGGSSFALGAASIVNERDAFPFAAIGMVMTAVCSTCVVSVPFVRDLLVRIAVGDMDVTKMEGVMTESVEALVESVEKVVETVAEATVAA